jgi:hypothetical protein
MAKYLYQLIEQLIIEFPPDEIQERLPNEGSTFLFSQELIPCGWYLYYGSMFVSVQCSEYHYCDFYPLSDSGAQFRYSHPYTETAELAIIECADKGHWKQTGWVEFEHGDTVDGYADLARIREVVKTVFEYYKA